MHMFNELLMENSDINNYYWDSKLPKFIRKAMCKHKRNKLRGKIKRFVDTDVYLYTSNDIYEISTYASYQPDDNLFKKTNEYNLVLHTFEEHDKFIFNMSMTYGNDPIAYRFNIISEPDKLKIDIYMQDLSQGYEKYINRKLASYSLGEKGLKEIVDLDKYIGDKKYILYALNAMFGEIAYEFMEDQLTRSERIYNGK